MSPLNNPRGPRLRLPAVLAAVLLTALLLPEAAWAAGNDVGKNLADLLRHYAAELYGGIVAVFSLVFLGHRRFGELAMFLLAAVVVAWMVFSPDQLASTARSLGKQLFG